VWEKDHADMKSKHRIEAVTSHACNVAGIYTPLVVRASQGKNVVSDEQGHFEGIPEETRAILYRAWREDKVTEHNQASAAI
jgi:hypothetical protein